MATLAVTDSTLGVRFTRAEKLSGWVRDTEAPRSAIRSVEVVTDALKAPRGLRAPGLGLPGLRKIGTWRAPGERTLVSVRRDQPALLVRLEGQRYDTWLIGADDAAMVADRIARPPT
jgi:hypothetical protein